jgi:hypothetical protein
LYFADCWRLLFSSADTRNWFVRVSGYGEYPFTAVTVATRDVGRYPTITPVEEAAQFRAHDWPNLDVMEKAVGLSACALAIDAKESDIYIGEGWRLCPATRLCLLNGDKEKKQRYRIRISTHHSVHIWSTRVVG